MKQYFILFLFLWIVLVPDNVNAYGSCSATDKIRLQKYASNIAYYYEYEDLNKGDDFSDVNFTITFTNVIGELFIYDESAKVRYNPNDKNEVVITGKNHSEYLIFSVYGQSSKCFNENISNIYITLPIYNKFHTDELCERAPEYSLCGKWVIANMSYDEFKEKVEDYIINRGGKSEIILPTSDLTTFEIVIGFLAKYSLLIFGSIIVMTSASMYYLIKKDEFDLDIKH